MSTRRVPLNPVNHVCSLDPCKRPPPRQVVVIRWEYGRPDLINRRPSNNVTILPSYSVFAPEGPSHPKIRPRASPPMFHTFNLTAPARHGPDPRAPSSALPSRQRQKVSRACDRCRTFRIKCGEKPCPRCVLDKVRCTWTSGPAAKQKSNILVSTG